MVGEWDQARLRSRAGEVGEQGCWGSGPGRAVGEQGWWGWGTGPGIPGSGSGAGSEPASRARAAAGAARFSPGSPPIPPRSCGGAGAPGAAARSFPALPGGRPVPRPAGAGRAGAGRGGRRGTGQDRVPAAGGDLLAGGEGSAAAAA